MGWRAVIEVFCPAAFIDKRTVFSISLDQITKSAGFQDDLCH
jgi:hypothetical protein